MVDPYGPTIYPIAYFVPLCVFERVPTNIISGIVKRLAWLAYVLSL